MIHDDSKYKYMSEATTTHIIVSLLSDNTCFLCFSSMDKVSSVTESWEVAHIISVPSNFQTDRQEQRGPSTIKPVWVETLKGILYKTTQSVILSLTVAAVGYMSVRYHRSASGIFSFKSEHGEILNEPFWSMGEQHANPLTSIPLNPEC